MSERRIIKFQQFKQHCHYTENWMCECGYSDTEDVVVKCNEKECKIFAQLPNAEPILEAAKSDLKNKELEFSALKSLSSNMEVGILVADIRKIKEALKSAGVEI